MPTALPRWVSPESTPMMHLAPEITLARSLIFILGSTKELVEALRRALEK